MIRHSVWLVVAVVSALGTIQFAQAQTRHWDDNGNDASKQWSVANNWDPDGTPQPGEAIFIGFGIPNAFDDRTIVDEDFAIDTLTVRGGADVDTNGNSLFVSDVDIQGPGVSIFVPPDGGVFSERIFIADGAILQLMGEADSTEGGFVETTDLQTTSNGSAGGHGTIDLILSAIDDAMSNGGTLFVTGRPSPTPFQALPGTLTITGTGTLDLDGATFDDGFVDVDDSDGGPFVNDTSLTLVIEVPLADSFSGQMDVGNGDTVNIADDWALVGAAGDPAVINFDGIGTHTLMGGDLDVGIHTQVNANGGTTIFQTSVVFNGDLDQFTLANNATVQFDEPSAFGNASHIINGNNAAIVVNSNLSIGASFVASGEDFDWDGDGANGETIVNASGQLNINVENVDDDGSDTFNGTITMNSGHIDVQVADGRWVMDGVLTMNSSATDFAVLAGDTVQIGNDSVALSADWNIGGTGIVGVTAPIVFESDADVNIAAGVILQTEGSVNFDSVTGANNAEFTGSGTWWLAGTNTFSEATTINMTGGSVDLDNSSTAAAVANDTSINAPLTINAANLLSYGTLKNNGGAISSSDLTVSHIGTNTGILTVNLDNPTGFWTVNNEGTLVLFNDTAEATLLAGSPVLIDGVLLVTGDVRTDARMQIEGTVSINTPGEPLRLSGGNLTDQPNTIVSGTIHGPGILGADTGTMLRGNGVINANVDFDGTAELLADGGMLTVNGAILDASIVGTLDSDGMLNVVNPWNMSGTVGLVRLQGGELRGGAVTTAGFGIIGSGLVSAPVINNTALSASSASGGTLLVQTAANNNDWDGTTGAGQLNALSGNLEIRDNAQFLFTGTVNVGTGHTAFANGFELRFNSGSTLNLDGGTYRANQTTFINGTVSVGAGGGRLQNDPGLGFVFVSGATATLNGDLSLDAATTVNTGVTFSGGGSLVNRALLTLVDNANVGVGIENQGDLEIGGMNTANIGQVTAGNFEQTADGELIIHLGGIASGAFDTLDIGGTAQLDGALRLFLQGGYVPVLGQGIEILQADLAVIGTFDSVIQPATMPAGLAFGLNYNPKSVVLKVIQAPGLPGDYNNNGTVDAADYVVWRKNDGSQAGYNTWRANYGRTTGSASSQIFAVPEPTGVTIGWILSLFILTRWRRAAN